MSLFKFAWCKRMLKKPRRLRRSDALVGRNIQALRLQRGLSQARLGEYLNVTQQQIQLYEKGKNGFGASQLSQLAAALGVPVEILINVSPTAPTVSERALLDRAQTIRLLTALDKIPSIRMREAIVCLIEGLGEAQSRWPERPRTRCDGRAPR